MGLTTITISSGRTIDIPKKTVAKFKKQQRNK